MHSKKGADIFVVNCCTLIIGSGYSSAGFALTEKNCLIAEETEMCDTHFYLPLQCYGYKDFAPSENISAELFDTFQKFGLFKNGMQNVNAFECAFCSFLKEHKTNVLLKSRVVSTEQKDGKYFVNLYTNSGFERVCADKLLDCRTVKNSPLYFTVLYKAEKNSVQSDLQEIFPGSFSQEAFYDTRYALYVPYDRNTDLNAFKLSLYNRWKENQIDAKILCFAPIAGTLGEAGVTNPVEAFEHGIKLAKERK